MLRIAVIGDVHDEQGRLEASLALLGSRRADLALLVGDIGCDPPWRSPERESRREEHDASVRRTLDRVRAGLDCPVLFVPGNHDLRDPAQDLSGRNCDRRVVEAAGVRLAGFGGSGPSRFGFPYEWSEEEADRALAGFPGGQADSSFVFLCHSPPSGCRLDVTRRQVHVGSDAVRRWIARARPGLFVCGHIHEAWGMEEVEGVPCINAGALGDPAAQEIVWVVDWDGGRPARIESRRRDAAGAEECRLWETSVAE